MTTENIPCLYRNGIYKQAYQDGFEAGINEMESKIKELEYLLSLADSVCCEEDVMHYTCAVIYKEKRHEYQTKVQDK